MGIDFPSIALIFLTSLANIVSFRKCLLILIRSHPGMHLKVGSVDRWKYTISRISGKSCTAVVFGGFGFKQRQMQKHESLYKEFDFNVVPIFSSVKQMTRPYLMKERGREFAEMLQSNNQPLVFHTISGSVWTLIHTLEYMDKEWRDENVKAIVFDSSPPEINCYAFGGWLAFLLKRNHLKPYLAQLFHPYIWFAGLKEWRREIAKLMFGVTAVIPRNANMLFIHGKNDPVLDYDYLADFIADLRVHKAPNASVIEKIFPNSRHAMSLIEKQEEYRIAHATQLLLKVPELIKVHSAGQ